MIGTPGTASRKDLADRSPGLAERDRQSSRRLSDWGASIAITLVVAAGGGQPPPAGNEWIYLPLLRKSADSSYLPGDWTFGGGFQEKAVFNAVFGPLVDLVGVETLAMVGRFVFWLILGRLLVALGRRLGCKPWMTVVSVVALLGINWSLGVGAAGPMSRFEASAVGKVLAFGALVAALDRRIPITAVLVGLAFTFHAAIGLWAGGAILVALIVLPETRRQTVRWIPIAGLFALPGLTTQLSGLLDSSMDSASAEFVALSRIPHHVDPFSFGERGPLILALILAFNIVWAWRERDHYELRLLGWIQALLVVVAVAGVAARVLGAYEFLLLMPFRVLPFLAPLLFFLGIGSILSRNPKEWIEHAWAGKAAGRSMVATGVMALAAIVLLWNPVPNLVEEVEETVDAWREAPDDLDLALMWVADNTPVDAVVASPPWVDEIFHLSERAQLVSWEAVPYDRPREWRQRLNVTVSDPMVWVEDNHPDSLAVAYRAVPLAQWERVSQDYGVSYVLTDARYDIGPVYTSGDWSVYPLGSSR